MSVRRAPAILAPRALPLKASWEPGQPPANPGYPRRRRPDKIEFALRYPPGSGPNQPTR